MLELFHERDLADGGRGGAFFGVEVDFFQGDELAGLAVAAFEYLFSSQIISCNVGVFLMRGLIIKDGGETR